MLSIPATTFLVLLAIVVVFQIALALGAPFGDFSMGGRFPGKFPVRMRLAAALQALLLSLLAIVVLVRDRVLLPGFYPMSTRLIWIAVAIFVLSLVMNLITPSKWERIIWAPVAAALLACTVVVALS